MAAILTRKSIMDKIEHRVLEVVLEVETAAHERAASVNRRAKKIILEGARDDGISKARGYSDAAHGRPSAFDAETPKAYREGLRMRPYKEGYALYLTESAARAY